MSDTTLNKTDSRVSALAEIKAQRVTYDPRIGEYAVKDDSGEEEAARGARRRTYSELRAAGLVTTASVLSKAVVELTNLGVETADEWELTSHDNIG